ncbi:MAG: type II secretion system ATPase GspE [Acidobacteriia bacterium]|nr:type II secretion system ATPase GspE [Terriglobia bacterium]
MIPQTKLLGEILKEQHHITDEDLNRALQLQSERGDKIGRLLVELGLVSERDVLEALQEQLGLPLLVAHQVPEVPLDLESFSPRFMRQTHCLPITHDESGLTVAMADPLDRATIESIQLFTGYRVKPVLAPEAEILDSIEKLYGAGTNAMGRLIENMEGEEGGVTEEQESIEHLKDMASEVPVIRFVNLLISRAVEQRASDIHIEPFEKDVKVRYRIDGILYNVETPPKALKAAIISRVKLMARLNIAERRLPQDGRIKLRVLGKEIDLRVSTLPTMYGESVVMRILDKSDSSKINLKALGFPERELKLVEALTARPHGIFLVTGPTGSGKTTTLYSALLRINQPDKKIITIEDPVEYQMDGVNQIQVNPQIGLTFASGLRSIVRQDPDVIMIGEIRDLETAEIAIRSSLTGHLVFSTLHTNDAPSSITRLLDMGVEDYLLASSLLGVLAQRLVRVICRVCRKPYLIDAKIIHAHGFNGSSSGEVTLYRGEGCEACGYTGYEGRVGIFELMLIDDALRRLIVTKEDANVIAAKAREQGMVTLREDGWQKTLLGITTLDEVLRVTKEI